jgi:cytochrome c peroxidase
VTPRQPARQSVVAAALLLAAGCQRAAPAVPRDAAAAVDRPFAAIYAADAGAGAFTEREWRRIRRMSPVAPLEADPTNRVADRPEAARLGYALFHDAALSVDGTVACARCHDPARAFADGLPLAEARGQRGRRNTPSLWFAATHRWQTWDGAADSLWAQPVLAWEHPREHGLPRDELARRLLARHGDQLRALFGEPTGDPLAVIASAGKCLAAYVRTLVPRAPSAFDRWVAGETSAMDPSAVHGLQLFLRVGCIRCHSGATFSDGDFHAVRFPDDPAVGPDHGRLEGAERARAHPLRAQGAYSDEREAMFPPNPTSAEDDGRFLTPTLRGVALTAPYGHAGTLPTLEAVVDLYAAGGVPAGDARATGVRDVFAEPFALRGSDRADLVAFLRALTPGDAHAP